MNEFALAYMAVANIKKDMKEMFDLKSEAPKPTKKSR